MAHKYSFDKIKKYITNKKPLKFKGLEKEDIVGVNNPEDFVSSFFVYNNVYDTIYSDSKITQTVKNKRRSIEDIYRICLYYFPNTSLTKTYKRLVEQIRDDRVSSAFCVQINRRVYREKRDEEECFFNSEPIDEFGVDFNEFDLDGIFMNDEDYGWGHDYEIDKEDLIIKL